MTVKQYHAVGKRRTAIARIWARPGEGAIEVNRKKLEDYIPIVRGQLLVMKPLQLTGMMGRLDIKVNVHGGGILGQADAIGHGISRALLEVNPEFRESLKRAGFLKRDSRVKERKKYGKRGARASYQYSKR